MDQAIGLGGAVKNFARFDVHGLQAVLWRFWRYRPISVFVAVPNEQRDMTADLRSASRVSRVDRHGCSWVNLTDGTIHGESAWPQPDDERDNWARVVGYEERVAQFVAYDGYLVEIVPLPWTGRWAVRFVVPQLDFDPERQYLGYPEDTHIKLFDTWEEARDRMRSCGFSYSRMSVVMPVHLASRLLRKEKA